MFGQYSVLAISVVFGALLYGDHGALGQEPWNNFMGLFNRAFATASLENNSNVKEAADNPVGGPVNTMPLNAASPPLPAAANSPEAVLGPIGNQQAQSSQEGTNEDWTSYFQYMLTRDHDTCLSRYICEVVSKPWVYGDYGYKVQRFFYLYTPDPADVAGTYYKRVASMSVFTWNCASQFPACSLNETEIVSLGTGHKLDSS